MNTTKFTLFFALILLNFAQNTAAKPTNSPFKADAFYQSKVLADINTYRHKHGLSPLKMSPIISQQAIQHSYDMATRSTPFGHQGFSKRMKYIMQNFSHFRGAAENVAYNDLGPQYLVNQWLESPAHRRNIEGNFNLTGIGVVRDSHGRVFGTEIFLKS